MLIALTLLIVMILLIYYYKNKSSSGIKKPGRRPIDQQHPPLHSLIDSNKYWGMYIECTHPKLCCQAVLLLDKKPFSINDVPTLPLENCTKKRCFCKHTGLLEMRKPQRQRRKVHDRRSAIRFENVTDRRAHTDRRSVNWEIRLH